MPIGKETLGKYPELTWNDIESWAGTKIASRGRRYQRNHRVSELATTADGCLIASVAGTRTYATMVYINEHGLPECICDCPYEFNCKHGVAVVLEYIERLNNNQSVPQAAKDNPIIQKIRDTEEETGELSSEESVENEIKKYLNTKSKKQLINLLMDSARRHPDVDNELRENKQFEEGDSTSLVVRLRKEIRSISDEPGWQNYWQGDGYTPDYSGVRRKLDMLLKTGNADKMLAIGKELIYAGVRQVSESNDEGETANEIASCMPVVVRALEQSSLSTVDKLEWALDVVLADEFDILGDFADYLMAQKSSHDWSVLADRLFERLKPDILGRGEDTFHRNYRRDLLTNWLIHALESAGRDDEIIPLCQSEAKVTGSYIRLVKRLMEQQQWEEAEHWIIEGIRTLSPELSGITRQLRSMLRDIRHANNDFPAVAAFLADEFVRYPSTQTYAACQEATEKVAVWQSVRENLLPYLETGAIPWKQENWLLPSTGIDEPESSPRNRFPLLEVLIDIAISEHKPEEVLHWYDYNRKKEFYYCTHDDRVARAIQDHYPDRAIAIWKKMVERLIAQVKPSAYEEAVSHLDNIESVLRKNNRTDQWNVYLQQLKTTHARKRRLMEILNSYAHAV